MAQISEMSKKLKKFEPKDDEKGGGAVELDSDIALREGAFSKSGFAKKNQFTTVL